MVFRRSSELCTILCAGDDEREIEREDVVCLRGSRGDRRRRSSARGPRRWPSLPTPGSPMRTGLFFVQRQKDLDDTFDLGVAADQRIELFVDGVLGEVAGELGGQALLRCVGCSCCCLVAAGLFPAWCAATLRGWRAGAGHAQSGRISAAKHFSSRSRAEREVLGADVLVGEAFGFFGGVGEDALALVGERQVDEVETFSRIVVSPWISACRWIRRMRANAGSGWCRPCPRAAGRAAGARSRCWAEPNSAGLVRGKEG